MTTTFTPQPTIAARRQLGQALLSRGLNPQANASSLSPFASLAQGFAGGFLGGRANVAEQGNQDIRQQTLNAVRDADGRNIGRILLQSEDPSLQVAGIGQIGKDRDRAIALAKAGQGSFDVDDFGRMFNKKTGQFLGQAAPSTEVPGTLPQVQQQTLPQDGRFAFQNPPAPAKEAQPRQTPGINVPPGAQRGAVFDKALTPGEKAVDKKFAQDVVEFSARGGFADVQKQLAQLESSLADLESAKGDILGVTGPIIGLGGGTALGDILAPTAAATREKVQEVVQRNLRTVLGAAFTAKEGDALIARAFNPRLEEAENARRIKRLITQIQTAAQQKAAAVRYFQEFGTLKGFTGKLPSFTDFDVAGGTPDTTERRSTRQNRFRIIN